MLIEPHYTAAVSRPGPKLVAECFAENRARLLAIAATVQRAVAETTKDRK